MNTEQIKAIFEQQRGHAFTMAQLNITERIERVSRIWKYLEQESQVEALSEALNKDLRKAPLEVWATEIGIVKQAVLTIKRQLKEWMQDEEVPGSIALAGMRSYIRYEPKGVCLIIAPWNYPLNLSIAPLVYALAAGNTVILKPSELAPHTARFMGEMIAQLFPAEEVAVIEGDASVAQALLELPFDHIFFTGSPAIGKVVMAAAAKHLCSVTLELGGKSPVIVDETADVDYHAEKIAWAKLLNNGQTCIAPDYVLVHEKHVERLLEGITRSIKSFYGDNPQQSPDLARMINDRHLKRVQSLIDDAVSKGAQLILGGQQDEKDLFLAPTVLSAVTEDMRIMDEEIFGPVLPVLTFSNKEEAVAMINRRPKPLDLYIGSRSKANINYFLQHTRAGNTVINEYMTSLSNPNLPFGGVNNSGIGKSGGKHSFIEFSNARGVMQRHWLQSGLKMIQPPFTDVKMRLLKVFYKLV
jgi:aldehyde dehydrogenase (NAD+)